MNTSTDPSSDPTSDPSKTWIKYFIDKYMSTNDKFVEDLQLLKQKLSQTSTQRQPKDNQWIVVFSHQMDINWISGVINENLLKYLLENEELFSKTFENRLNKRIKTQLNDRKIWLCLKYKNLPQNLHLKTFQELKTNSKQLVSVGCIQIVSMSHPFGQLIGRKYVARNPVESEEPIKLYVKRMRETFFKSPEKDYREVKEGRVLTEIRKIWAKVGPNGGQNGLYPIEITVFMETIDSKQHLYNGLHLQSVVLLRKNESSNYVLLSFDKICRPFRPPISEFRQFLLQFPETFRELYYDRFGKSNYSFALSLAYIFADSVSISGSFFRLKLGLLLSLLSLNEYPKKNHSSVLVICDDTPMIRRHFEWSSSLSQHRYIHKSLSVPMTGKSRELHYGSETINCIDSGALQLGSDGITIISCVSNLNELSVRDRTALFHALETNEVIARQSQPSEPSLKEFELKSTIWAAIENDITERLFQPNSNRSPTIQWTHVFGMVYVIPKSTNKYIYTLRPGTKSSLSFDEWNQIIQNMSQINPKMTPMAESLLQNYYVSIRLIRGSKLNHISFESLISLSKSMAKLSLRQEVTKYDALMAILLYEESLTSRLSERQSPLSVEPLVHVLTQDIDRTIGQNCDQSMAHFENCLTQFIAKYLTNNPKRESFSQYFSQNEE